MIIDEFKKTTDEKPELSLGDKLCGGCWEVAKHTPCWTWFNFRHLDPTWLCPKCLKVYSEHLGQLQEMGL